MINYQRIDLSVLFETIAENREMGSPEFSWKLKDHPKLGKGRTVAVVVLDGWGEANPNQFNCIHVADTPTMDSLKKVIFFIFLLF